MAEGKNNRWRAVGLAVAAAALLIGGAFSSRWIVGTDFDIETRVGLRHHVTCIEGDCTPVSLAEVAASPAAPAGAGTFRALAAVAFWAGLAASLALLLAAALAALARPVHWPVAPESAAILTSIACIGLAVAVLVSHPYQAAGWGTGPGFLIYGAGATAGLLAGILLGRLPRDDIDHFSPPFEHV